MYAKRVKTYYYRLMVFSLLSLFLIPYSFAERNDSIYNGTQIKLDILSPILIPGVNNWQMQHYEIAANVRLKQRFYPTLELGYAGGNAAQGDTISYTGKGGFFRVGCDINPLKKHPESPHALLVGVRFGTAAQQYDQTLANDNGDKMRSYGAHADCWGEIAIGCQVEIAQVNKTSFYMGWMGRLKCLFTRTGGKTSESGWNIPDPIYIPGFGPRDTIGWGANYYLGWTF